MKTCKGCNATLPLSSFHRNRRSKDGHNRLCGKCNYAVAKTWKSAHPERRKLSYRRRRLTYINNGLMRHYGIGVSEYVEMLREQQGLCASCYEPASTDKDFSLCVDHDHFTGKVRSLICNHCNLAIGHLKDSPERAELVAAYLRSHQ